MNTVPRSAESLLVEFADALRVVIINGPRQSGKTTLLKQFQKTRGGSYRTLDDQQMLQTALDDPVTFARFGERPCIIDEVQRGGDWLVRAIKMTADESRSPGQFLLSGSSRFLTIPTLSESLAGRAAFIDLWPLSVAERTGGLPDFCTRIFAPRPDLLQKDSPWKRDDYLSVIAEGGYPEAIGIGTARARSAWYSSYLTTIINRDINDFAEIHHARSMPRLLALLAARAGSTIVLADIARSVELGRDTTRNYLSYLDIVFLTIQVPAWSVNLTSKIAKTPKIFISDSGLATHLLGLDAAALRQPGHAALGGLLETFVATELTKLCAISDINTSLWHLRERDGREVDFILEGPQGSVVGIEVKATVSPGDSTVRHLRWLRDKLGDRFAAGIVLHLGPHSGSFGDGIYALPLSALWGHAYLG